MRLKNIKFGFRPLWVLIGILIAWPAIGQVSHSLTIAWLASPTTGVKYNVYRNTAATGTFTKIATDVAALTYVDTAGIAGTTYFYEVSAICDTTTTCPTGISGESALSSVSNGTTFLGSPQAPPAAPTVTAQ